MSGKRSPKDFHRRRAEAEMDMALGSTKLSVAILHLELAKRHRQRCAQFNEDRQAFLHPPVFFFNGTDKEC
jgi:endonuclease/exonuclease/phosphatase family metal-dependent hydrolase